MQTSNVSQDRIIPYWDEIRNLSIEDKYSLIAKIEKENRVGRCIPNSQVESYIKAKRGWK